MNIRIRREYILSASILGGIAAVTVLFFNFEKFGTITSSEIDEILYRRLDTYQRTYEENADLNRIFEKALSNPNELTGEDRQVYLMNERLLLVGWSTAYNYKNAGEFDEGRFEVWDTWYISEFKRRPSFTWTQNRAHFSDSFIRHVDASLFAPQ